MRRVSTPLWIDTISNYLKDNFTWNEVDPTFDVLNPANGEVLATLPDFGEEQTRVAIDKADQGYKTWQNLPATQRSKALDALYGLMLEHKEKLADLISLENGKPFPEACEEVEFAIAYLPWFAGEALRIYEETIPTKQANRRFVVKKQPVGVVAAITPWNFPATMITRKVAPAIAAGCSVILKPAPETPLSALYIAALACKAEIPSNVFQVLPSNSAETVGATLLQSPTVKKVAFTGSVSVGKKLISRSAENITRVGLELGGNAPFIVFDDAEVEKAVAAALAIKFLRVGGQSCISANRIFVQESILEEFTALFVAETKKLRVAPAFEAGAQVGPMIHGSACDRVLSLIGEAVAEGAKVLCGGTRLSGDGRDNGHFIDPCVLTQVEDSMRIAREEIFGPVASILSFDDEAEVIRRANHTPFGLAAYVFTADSSEAERIADQLECGFVGINDANGYIQESPFGGWKESGLGREGGRQGIEAYLELKTIVTGL